MELEALLAEHRITLRVGHALFAPTGTVESDAPAQDITATIHAAVEAYNEMARLPGLEDELNPLVLEWAKVAAFLEWLPTMDAAARGKISGGVVLLTDSHLGLHESSATILVARETTAELYAASAVQNYVPLNLKTPLAEDARDRVEHARESVIAFDEQVAEREQTVASVAEPSARATALRELALAKRKRWAAASVWERNARLLAERSPSDAALRREVEAAVQASERFLVPPWMGMPTPPNDLRRPGGGSPAND